MAPAFSFDGTVTWIVNPNHFYIRLKSDEERKCNVEYLINGFVKNNELRRPKSSLKLELPASNIGDTLDFGETLEADLEQFFLNTPHDEDFEETDVEPLLKKALWTLLLIIITKYELFGLCM